jgi:hypothetical protein
MSNLHTVSFVSGYFKGYDPSGPDYPTMPGIKLYKKFKYIFLNGHDDGFTIPGYLLPVTIGGRKGELVRPPHQVINLRLELIGSLVLQDDHWSNEKAFPNSHQINYAGNFEFSFFDPSGTNIPPYGNRIIKTLDKLNVVLNFDTEHNDIHFFIPLSGDNAQLFPHLNITGSSGFGIAFYMPSDPNLDNNNIFTQYGNWWGYTPLNG